MTPEQLSDYTLALESQKQDMLASVLEEKQCVQRARLYRVYGTKKQYEFLRQQRGICRHLYNLCLSDINDYYQSNKHLIQYLHFLLDSDEIELTEKQAEAIKKSIYSYSILSESELRRKYQPDSYWKNNDKAWGLATPSNLRTSTIQNLLSNLHTALKTTRGQFQMSFLSKRKDKLSFHIPFSTQQINVKTGTIVPPTPPKIKKKKTKTTVPKKPHKIKEKTEKKVEIRQLKNVVFQYMTNKCPGQGLFTVRVRDKDRFPNSKDEIKHDGQFIYKSGCWYISLVQDVNVHPPTDTRELKICSIDPGIKTPYTVYDPQDGSITEIGTSKDSLERLKNPSKTLSTHARLERIRRLYKRGQSRLDIMKKEAVGRKAKHKCKRMEKYLTRLRHKKKCLIDELHYKTIKYLTSNYDVIIMPYFDTQPMLRQRNLSRRSKQALLDLNFSLFRQRLIGQVEIQGKIWLEVGEAYTTKSCVQCGHIQNLNLSQRIFKCPRCHLKLGRDVHSAISILVKNAEIALG